MGTPESLQITDSCPDILVTVKVKGCSGDPGTVNVANANVEVWTSGETSVQGVTNSNGQVRLRNVCLDDVTWSQSFHPIAIVPPMSGTYKSANGVYQHHRTKFLRAFRGYLMDNRVLKTGSTTEAEIRITSWLKPQHMCDGRPGTGIFYSRGIDGDDPDVTGPGYLTTPRTSPTCPGCQVFSFIDVDEDGIDDGLGHWIANRYAPVVLIPDDESNLPASVDWLLQRTGPLKFRRECVDEEFDIFPLPGFMTIDGLDDASFESCNGNLSFSNRTRSSQKKTTFYLPDVSSSNERGSTNPSDWITYVHSFPNTVYATSSWLEPYGLGGGITIQYWRFYAYNDAINNHGGDWEAVSVVLAGNLKPWVYIFNGHSDVEWEYPAEVQTVGRHVRVYTEGGGHASFAGSSDLFEEAIWNPWETWVGGSVDYITCDVPFADGLSGGLVDIGERYRPLNAQEWVDYSGLWGSIDLEPWIFGGGVSFSFSGYWGPAYNETQATCENDPDETFGEGDRCSSNSVRAYIQAWCGPDGVDGSAQGMDYGLVTGGREYNCIPPRWGDCTSESTGNCQFYQ